jgi:hypothetical protein
MKAGTLGIFVGIGCETFIETCAGVFAFKEEK